MGQRPRGGGAGGPWGVGVGWGGVDVCPSCVHSTVLSKTRMTRSRLAAIIAHPDIIEMLLATCLTQRHDIDFNSTCNPAARTFGGLIYCPVPYIISEVPLPISHGPSSPRSPMEGHPALIHGLHNPSPKGVETVRTA